MKDAIRSLIKDYEDRFEELSDRVKKLEDELLKAEEEKDDFDKTWTDRIKDLKAVISGEKPRTSGPRTLGEAIEQHRQEPPDPIGR